jgi:hypothetical protein
VVGSEEIYIIDILHQLRSAGEVPTIENIAQGNSPSCIAITDNSLLSPIAITALSYCHDSLLISLIKILNNDNRLPLPKKSKFGRGPLGHGLFGLCFS